MVHEQSTARESGSGAELAARAGLHLARHKLLLDFHDELHTAAVRVKQHQGVAAIHAVRVQARRLRTLLNVWRRDCQPQLHAQLQFDLRDVGRTLAPARETDVRYQLFMALIRRAGNHEVETEALMLKLQQARAVERRCLRAMLHEAMWLHRLERIQHGISDQHLLALPKRSGFTADVNMFARKIRRLNERLGRKKHGMRYLHSLRIAVKKTRYFGEALHALGARIDEPLLPTLRKLQNLLGELHDSWQMLQWLSACDLDDACRQAVMRMWQARFEDRRQRFERFKKTVLRKGLLAGRTHESV
ncbi:MAG: CHAD domain-containing protein [Steroidobacteraceae bacterium]